MTGLLDVNVLLALAWPNHAHHEAASDWFQQQGEDDWATCLFTQSAFVRLSLNPKVTQTPIDAATVLAGLAKLVGHSKHRYLVEAPPLVPGAFQKIASVLIGHRQVTDATLLHMAAYHGVALVTFDQAIESLAVESCRVETIRY